MLTYGLYLSTLVHEFIGIYVRKLSNIINEFIKREENLMKLKLILLFCVVNLLNAREYVAPPTTTYGAGGVISDEAMENCVKIYNEATWLAENIKSINVNQYDSNSVNNYNNKASEHSSMINYFNQNCAGKQSYSAWKAAQKLNGK